MKCHSYDNIEDPCLMGVKGTWKITLQKKHVISNVSDQDMKKGSPEGRWSGQGLKLALGGGRQSPEVGGTGLMVLGQRKNVNHKMLAKLVTVPLGWPRGRAFYTTGSHRGSEERNSRLWFPLLKKLWG